MQFFAQAGFPCPSLRNPSDHFLRCINSDFDKVKATLKGSMKMRVRAQIHLLRSLNSCILNMFPEKIFLLFVVQFEGREDPLDKITTAEAIRRLTDFYTRSQYYYAAREKVDEISRVVCIELPSLPLHHLLRILFS